LCFGPSGGFFCFSVFLKKIGGKGSVLELELLQRSDSVAKVTTEELVVAAKQFCSEYFATRSRVS